MIIDLSNELLYVESSLDLSKKYSFIFGKNGTGKSTLTRVISEQGSLDYDVRTFAGFEDVVDEHSNLNAVVLGKENSKISKQIKEHKAELDKLEKERNLLRRAYEPLEDGTENLYSDFCLREKQVADIEGEIESKLKTAAAEIKRQENPRFAVPAYNITHLRKDMQFAKQISDEEEKAAKLILKSDVKIAPDVKFPDINIKALIEQTNGILCKYVKEKVHVVRIGNDPEKVDFVKRGLKIHKPGDICTFCGNTIFQEEYAKLQSYFSADEVKEFQQEINEQIKYLVNVKDIVAGIVIDKSCFYPSYTERVLVVMEALSEYKRNVERILNALIESLEKKLSMLFIEMQAQEFSFVDSMKVLRKEYQELVAENNANDLKLQQEEAKRTLLYGAIYKALIKMDYATLQARRTSANKDLEIVKGQIQIEKQKVEGPTGIEVKIEEKKGIITELKSQMRDEKKLAEEISVKLRNLVSFELEYIPADEENGKGMYKIRDVHTDKIRNVTELSTGEKNIIAFLYFIGKLHEFNEGEERKPQIIIFDDPMNSNDDNMQYLMMGELDTLMKELENQNSQFVLLTHNIHFYVNVNYQRKKEQVADYIHLESVNGKTIFNYVNAREDFKTSYQALWSELRFLYCNENAGADLLLNPARRIFETYIKFIGVTPNEFYKRHMDAKKLFDVNSHSIDDLCADLNSNTKEQILNIMKACFQDNSATAHFDKYWSGQ